MPNNEETPTPQPTEKTKTSLGMDENLEALLSYVLGWVTGLIFFILEKESKYVKFHAMQSLITFLALFVLMIVLSFIPIIGWIINLILPFLALILWILLMVKAYQGEKFKLPVVGDIAEEQANK